jgi:hypothetical protein
MARCHIIYVESGRKITGTIEAGLNEEGLVRTTFKSLHPSAKLLAIEFEDEKKDTETLYSKSSEARFDYGEFS